MGTPKSGFGEVDSQAKFTGSKGVNVNIRSPVLNLNEYGIGLTIPSVSLSPRELEQWVCYPASGVVDKLLEILNDPERRTWLFFVALGELSDTPDPILEASWK